MRTTTQIQLKINIIDLRAIYFRDGNEQYLFGPATKRQSFALLFALIGFPFYAIRTIQLDNSWPFMLGCIFMALFIYDYWRVAKPIITWRRSVEVFLKNAAEIKDLRLIYNDEYLVHIQDEEEMKLNWNIIKKAAVNEQLIWLYAHSDVLLPRNSMTQQEFDALVEMVRTKVENLQATVD